MEQTKNLKKALAEAAFAADELRLFLDTHPCDRRALEDYRRAAEESKRLRERICDPICSLDAGRGGSWDWTSTPWPWEMEG